MAMRAELLEQLKWRKFPVLDDGFVCLVDVMGDDAAVVQAARVSYGEGTRKVSDDRTLIRYLMRHLHTTPFEMAELKLLVRVPMDTWRQWIRHRTANVNEYSTRYSIAIDATQRTNANGMGSSPSPNQPTAAISSLQGRRESPVRQTPGQPNRCAAASPRFVPPSLPRSVSPSLHRPSTAVDPLKWW